MISLMNLALFLAQATPVATPVAIPASSTTPDPTAFPGWAGVAVIAIGGLDETRFFEPGRKSVQGLVCLHLMDGGLSSLQGETRVGSGSWAAKHDGLW